MKRFLEDVAVGALVLAIIVAVLFATLFIIIKFPPYGAVIVGVVFTVLICWGIGANGRDQS